jgi:hypothetical protein
MQLSRNCLKCPSAQPWLSEPEYTFSGGYAKKARIFFGKKEHQKVTEELKKAIQVLDKAKGGSLIISHDQNLLTAYKNR